MLRFLESIAPIFIATATGMLLLSISFLVVLNSRKSKEFSFYFKKGEISRITLTYIP